MKKLLTILILISYNLLFSAHEAIKYNPEANCPQTPDLLRLEAPIKETYSKAYRKYVAECKKKVQQAINCSSLTKDLYELLKSYTCISYSQWKQNGKKLIQAVASGDIKATTELLEFQEVDVDFKNSYGDTVLMEASFYGYKNIVGLLIEKGADVNAKNKNGDTALMLSSHHGYIDVVEVLLKNGANPNIKNNDGWTPLLAALLWDDKLIAKLLIKKGADVKAEDNRGNTVFKLAKNKDIIDLLIKKWASS